MAILLDRASKKGEVRIKRQRWSGIHHWAKAEKDSPLNVAGIDLDLTTDVKNYISPAKFLHSLSIFFRYTCN